MYLAVKRSFSSCGGMSICVKQCVSMVLYLNLYCFYVFDLYCYFFYNCLEKKMSILNSDHGTVRIVGVTVAVTAAVLLIVGSVLSTQNGLYYIGGKG